MGLKHFEEIAKAVLSRQRRHEWHGTAERLCQECLRIEMDRGGVVYLVMACMDYEGSSPVRAFLEREAADRFAAECTAHQEAAPKCPGVNDDDALWDVFYADSERWRASHPAKDNYGADSYRVREVPLSVAAVDPVGGRVGD
jgi:hypothetical protein